MTDSVFLPRGLIRTTQSTEPTVYLCNLLVVLHSSLEVIILNAHFIANVSEKSITVCMSRMMVMIQDGGRDVIALSTTNMASKWASERCRNVQRVNQNREVNSLSHKARLVIVRMKR